MALLQETEGIHLIDRTPLDPITFSPQEDEMKTTLCANERETLPPQ